MSTTVISIAETQAEAQQRALFFQARGAQVTGPFRTRTAEWANTARGHRSADAWGLLDDDVWVVVAVR